MGNKRILFEPNRTYHIYNHGNANDLIFREDTNYRFFLKRYHNYVSHIAETYAYCLMPNHFHFLLKLKNENELISLIENKYPNSDPRSFENFADLFSNQFKNFLISYAKAFNKLYGRKGSLFLDNLNRRLIETDDYLIQAIRYIHLNPVKHGFVNKPEDWRYSSFSSYLSDKTSLLKRDYVIQCFGGIESFLEQHSNPQSFENFADLDFN